MAMASCLIGRSVLNVGVAAIAASLLATTPRAAIIWTEGEKFVKADVKRHPWWYDKVKKDQLSGGDYISNWSDKPGEIEYAVSAHNAGAYEFWVRTMPVGTKLSYTIAGVPATEIDLAKE